MEFEQRIKGKLTETLVSELLEHAGYKVVPLGIEQIIREVKDVESKTSNLPRRLRTLPDFLVTDAALKDSWLVEVKYRHRWNDKTIADIEEALTNQVRYWERVYCLIFVGNCDGENVTASTRSGIFQLVLKNDKLAYINRDNTYPWKNADWKFSQRIESVFTNLRHNQSQQAIKKCCDIVDTYSSLLPYV